MKNRCSNAVGAAIPACRQAGADRPLTKGAPNSGAPAYRTGRHRGAPLHSFFKNQAWIPVFTGMTTWLRQQKNLFKGLKGLSFLRKQESRSCSLVLKDPKGISVIFLVIAMLLMITIGYVFSYLIPTKQKSVVFPIQSTQAFFIAQSGVEFAVRYAQDNGWTTMAALNNLNNAANNARPLGSGRFTLTYGGSNDILTSVGEVPTGTQRRQIHVSKFTHFLMSISYIASASNPVDPPEGSNTTNPTVVTPPGGLQAGDLVLMIGQSRDSTATLNISNNGGQNWTVEPQQNQTNCRIRLFWCMFNGAWTPAGNPNPSVSFGNTNPHTVVMHVFRPSNTSSVWQEDVAQAANNFPAPGAPNYTVTIPGITTITDGALVFATWASTDDNQWGAPTAGWTTAGANQYRNTSGADQSQTHAYKVMATAGAAGNVSKNQTAVGPDAGAYLIIAFKTVITCPP